MNAKVAWDNSLHQRLTAVLLETSELGQRQSDLDFCRTNESPECPAASDLLLHGSAGEIVLRSRGGEKNKFGNLVMALRPTVGEH